MRESNSSCGHKVLLWIGKLIIPFLLFPQAFTQTGAFWIGDANFSEGGTVICNDSVLKRLYLGGYNGDSTIILLIDYSGNLINEVSFKASSSANTKELLSDLKFNSTGTELIGTGSFLSGAQIGGYCFSLTPGLVLNWVREFPVGSNGLWPYSIHDLGPQDPDYQIIGAVYPNNDGFLIKVSKTNGLPSSFGIRNYNLSSAESFLSAELGTNNDLFVVSRVSYSANPNSFRPGVTRISSSNGQVLTSSSYMANLFPIENARLYGEDLVLKNDTAFTVGYGSFGSSNLDASSAFFSMHDPVSTNQILGYQIDFVEFEWVKAKEVLRTTYRGSEAFIIFGEGKLAIGSSSGVEADQQFMLCMNRNGVVNWAKSYGEIGKDFAYEGHHSQNQCIEMSSEGAKYAFTGTTKSLGFGDENMILVFVDEEGEFLGDESCLESNITPIITPRTAVNVINFQTNSSSVSSNARNAVENLPHLTPKVACAPRVSKEEGSTTGSGSLVSYPNPATSDLVITHDLTDESDLEMGIYNSQGKQIYQRKLALGETKLHLDAASWPRGVYFVFLRSEGKMQINGKIVLL